MIVLVFQISLAKDRFRIPHIPHCFNILYRSALSHRAPLLLFSYHHRGRNIFPPTYVRYSPSAIRFTLSHPPPPPNSPFRQNLSPSPLSHDYGINPCSTSVASHPLKCVLLHIVIHLYMCLYSPPFIQNPTKIHIIFLNSQFKCWPQ